MHTFIASSFVQCFAVLALFAGLSAAPSLADNSAGKAAAKQAAAAILEIEGDEAYGQFLAGECITCHQETGRADGIPAIVGIEQEYFVRSIVEYQTNVRDNEVMRLHVQNLRDEEVAALAAYFATLDPQ